MNVFVTGASGYIGGSVAAALVSRGHRVRGLLRSADRAEALRTLGIEPVTGTLDDMPLLAAEAKRADAVVNAASSDHRGAIEALTEGLAGSSKPLLHTSGISVCADDARGEASDKVHDEDTPIAPEPERLARAAVDRLVVAAAKRGVRSVVLCNPLIYGHGTGLHRDSIQIPLLARVARRDGVARCAGKGLNVWSTAHLDDVVDLYLLALESAPAGAFFFVENGESSYRAIADAIGKALGLGPAQPWPMPDAIREWGFERTVLSLASNSRVRAKRARALLGWQPRHRSVVDWIARELR